jgi:hypothetical protein
MTRRKSTKLFIYRDNIGFGNSKYSIAEVIGTLAVLAALACAAAQVL